MSCRAGHQHRRASHRRASPALDRAVFGTALSQLAVLLCADPLAVGPRDTWDEQEGASRGCPAHSTSGAGKGTREWAARPSRITP